jgi:zinc D-Ala-D-Ala carboxypeptidase
MKAMSPLGPGPRVVRLAMLLFAVVLVTGVAATVVSAGSLPPCRVTDVVTAKRSYNDWQTTLLDTTYKLTASYVPPGLHSTAEAGLNSGQRVRGFIIADLRAMAKSARTAGARLAVQSAYRSYSTQAATFSYWVRVSGYAAAIKSSARAGHSEHQLGTTIDFRSYGGSAPWYYADWGKTRAGTWLRTNAWRYGFVMSYPPAKTSVTCYAYEPWHFRYVGRKMAAAIHASGLTLREYLWRQQTAPPPAPATPPPGAESPGVRTPGAALSPSAAGTPVAAGTPAAPTAQPTPTQQPVVPFLRPTPAPSTPAVTPAATP